MEKYQKKMKKTRRFQKVFDSSSLLRSFEGIINGHQRKAEEREKERQEETEEKQRQQIFEADEREKLLVYDLKTLKMEK